MALTDYLKETRGELKHVNWPTRQQAITYTLLVIGVSIVIALFLALCDYGFSSLLQHFILK